VSNCKTLPLGIRDCGRSIAAAASHGSRVERGAGRCGGRWSVVAQAGVPGPTMMNRMSTLWPSDCARRNAAQFACVAKTDHVWYITNSALGGASRTGSSIANVGKLECPIYHD
jgi:hypothetical protein